MTEVEQEIARLRAKRDGFLLSYEAQRSLDRQIAVLVRAWRSTGGKLKIVGSQ